ncbi:response regulator [Actomonas aquatica]|uniref:Response regulator n=1 Tax=Actomonas aquatica TaxID=2866162 RepID=A0ABZ1C5L0_9BACT|nr:response regulator [Opitutus sp. WL0086]WRQ87014.1 response regulator [Opitutus sp. WL0086]
MQAHHILSIDDEDIIRELLGELLEAHGYRFTGVGTPHEALNIARSDPPDLIITDLQLEESDGLELVEKMAELVPDAPVILLTGILFDSQTVNETLSNKISTYISKTAPLSDLLAEVKRLLKDR